MWDYSPLKRYISSSTAEYNVFMWPVWYARFQNPVTTVLREYEYLPVVFVFCFYVIRYTNHAILQSMAIRSILYRKPAPQYCSVNIITPRMWKHIWELLHCYERLKIALTEIIGSYQNYDLMKCMSQLNETYSTYTSECYYLQWDNVDEWIWKVCIISW